MMIQQQTLAVDSETRARLIELSRLIRENCNNIERVKALIAQHDEIMKRAPVAVYDPREESKWA
jgi:hypothetical protein